MKKENLIDGQLPEFGNPVHIKWLREKAEIMNGEINFHEISWMPARYIDGGGKTKPRFEIVDDRDDEDCVVDYVPCPRCARLHILLVCFDPQQVPYEQSIQIDEDSKEFDCWNCGLEFEVDERMVYVKMQQ